jgi:mannose-6-phosphate isomerase-like protein (cupin superfamily)
MSATQATPFTVRGTPLLSAGNTQTLLANAPCLWAHVKVYAEGGENGVHAHPVEDHLFFVLAGEATFVDAEGGETVVGPYDGMLVPRGVAYAFKSTGNTNLVMVRVGAPTDTTLLDDRSIEEAKGHGIPRPIAQRVGVDGGPAPGLSEANKTGAIPGVPVPGRMFGA